MLSKLTKIMLIVALCVGVSSCAPKQWHNDLSCNKSEKEVIDNVIRILLEEGYEIASEDNNFVSAHKKEPFIPIILDYKIKWDVSAQSNKIIANAYINFLGLIHITADDELNESYKSYWRVRRKLEKVCNGKMVIINTISDNDE